MLVSLAGGDASVSGDGTVTVRDVPGAITFSDRPEREAGRMPLVALARNWREIAGDDPPTRLSC
jgi:hypothetical protein